jgi:regulator of protease activity HflC (stomatin/prohibitin superfamily)
MDGITIFLLVIFFLLALTVWKGLKIVPEQEAWIIERFGKFDRKLEPGLNILVPYIEYVAYKHTLKEQAIDVPEQSGITKDNVTLTLDGVIYVRIVDPVAASYGVSEPIYAVIQLAQTTMRSEIGKLTMDETFEEREKLNINIVNAINEAAKTWGIQCMRYEIRNINPPNSVLKAMEMQVAAERQKRADVLESEGKRQAQINMAEGAKQAVVLESEAAMTDQVNRARGEAEAIFSVAEATAKGIEIVASAITKSGGSEAVSLKVAQEYVVAFEKLAKQSTTLIIPANVNDIGSMVAQAVTVFDSIKNSAAVAAANNRSSGSAHSSAAHTTAQIAPSPSSSAASTKSSTKKPSPWDGSSS